MKNSIRKLTALALVLAMVLSMSALAAKETPSKGFKLPAVKERATEAPAAPEAPAEGEESAAPEATEAPAEGEAPAPEATEAPAEETKPEPEVETVIGKAYVSLENADSSLNVRAAATTESDRLGSLNHGDEVSVLGYEGDWTKIKFAGATGYVKSSFLSDAPAAPEAPAEPEVTAEPEATEAPAEPEVTAEPEATEAPAEPEVTAEPETTEAPAEPEVTAEPEATEAPAEPEVTEVPELTVEPTAEPTVEPTAEPTVEPSVEPEVIAEVYTALGEADVRLEGDGLSEILVTLPEGTELVVLEVVGEWVKVEVDGVIGYIYIDSVSGIEIEEEELPEDVLPEPSVTIFSSRRAVMEMGETVYLTSKLKNGEGYEIVYQWACDKGQGNGFELVDGATSDSYSFTASVETLAYDWQLLVFYKAIV